MADFVININAEPVIPYTVAPFKIQRDNCVTPYTETIPLGLLETLNTPGIEWIFRGYTGVGWSTLRIYDVEYSDEAGFYVEYAGSKLLPNVDPNVAVATIDVTTVNANESVPTLQIELDASTLTQNDFIKFTVEIEDTATNLGGKLDVYFNLVVVQCPVVNPKTRIVIDSTTDTSCFIEKVVTVKVPAEGSRYVSGTTINGFGSITGGALPATITSDTQYTLRIDASFVGTVTTYSRVELKVKDTVTSGTTLASTYITRNHGGNIC
jgi:hypothetical protein